MAEAVKVTPFPIQMVWLSGFVVTAGPIFTVCVRTAEVLPLKLGSPLYWAVIEWDPVLSEEAEKVACPEASRVSVSMMVAPSLKSTVPAGIPAPVGLLVTTAVKVTAWPEHEGLADELKVVVELAF